jgi:hypothetical protein
MKVDQEYLKGLLEAFEAAESPTTNILELKEKGFDYGKNEFIFHLQVLSDQSFIEMENGSGLGFHKGADGNVSWSVAPLRLTAQGHDFISALRNKEVWNTLKSEFKDASIGTLWSVSKQLLEGYTKKKVMALIGAEE